MHCAQSATVLGNCLRYANPAAPNRSLVSTCVGLCWCAPVPVFVVFAYLLGMVYLELFVLLGGGPPKLILRTLSPFVYGQLPTRNASQFVFEGFAQNDKIHSVLVYVFSFHGPCQGRLFVQCCWFTWAAVSRFL